MVSIIRFVRAFIAFLVIVVVASNAFSQDSENGMVQYTPDFEFNDGIFLNFQQVKTNHALPYARIITNYDHTDPDFYNNLLAEKKLYFFDENGIRQEVAVSNIWGFSRNGILYIRLSEGFSRVTIVGSICHFVANITTYDTRYYDPYSYYNPYYYNPYMSMPRSTRNSEMKQFLIDFETGKVMDYDVKSIEVLLMQDPELHDEFAALKKRKQKQLKFLYIRKFNERNPLYFPSTK